MLILYTKLEVKRHDIFLDSGMIDPTRDSKGCLKVNFETFETSEKNLFVVDACNIDPDQVMIAAGQGASAAMEIHQRTLIDHGI